MAIDGFCGCCNPTNFALLPDGGIVTSEKGLNRIKIYGAHGGLQGVVAGPEHLATDRRLARRACDDCRIGYSMPVASDVLGRALVLDVTTQRVRLFEKRSVGSSA